MCSPAPSLLFQQLKPVCVAVANKPSLATLNSLKERLEQLNDGSIQESALLTYVVFPLKLNLQRIQEKDDSLMILTLDTLGAVYDKAVIRDESIFLDQVNACCALLSSKKILKNGLSLLSQSSEEKKSRLIRILCSVFIRSHLKPFSCLFQDKNLPILGHVISLLLAIVDQEASKNLKQQSLEAIHALCDSARKWTPQVQESASSALASFIPGISIAMQKSICGDPKSGYLVACSSLNVWSSVIYLVLNDDTNMTAIQDGRKTAISECNVNTSQRQKPLGIVRDFSWLSSTAGNISILIKKLFGVVSCRSHRKVCIAALGLCKTVLTNCFVVLDMSVGACIEFVASCMAVDDTEMMALAQDVFQRAQEKFKATGSRDSLAIVESNLDSLLLALPRILHFSDVKQKEIQLSKLYGYFQVLGCTLERVLNSSSFLDRLMLALLQVFDVDLGNVKILEERDSNELHSFVARLAASDTRPQITRTKFRYLPAGQLAEVLDDVCKQLVMYCDVAIIINYILDLFETDPTTRIQCGLLIKRILRACTSTAEDKDTAHTDCSDYADIVSQIIEQFVSKEWMDLPVTAVQEPLLADSLPLWQLERGDSVSQFRQLKDGLTAEKLNYNVHLICVLLEVMAACSSVTKSRFQLHLITVLYPMLEKLGNGNTYIKTTAVYACQEVGLNCGSVSITDLITRNADYLLNAITLSFRHLALSTSAPSVLSVVFEYASSDTVVLLADIMDELFDVLDRHQEDLAYAIMNVLKCMNSAVARCFLTGNCPNGSKQSNLAATAKHAVYDASSYSTMFDDYCRTRSVADGSAIDEDAIDSDTAGEIPDTSCDETSTTVVVPQHFQMVIKALERCVSYLSNPSLQFLVAVFDVVQTGIIALSERENDLLPLIHKLWPALLHNTKSSQQVIATRALSVVQEMICWSGDFMRQRVVKELLPHCCTILATCLQQWNHKASQSDTSKYSRTSKFVIKVMEFLSVSLPALEIQGKDLLNCLGAMQGYLQLDLPNHMEECALTAIKSLHEYKPDEVWLFLATSTESELHYECRPPFKSVIFNRNTTKSANTGINCQQLMEEFQENDHILITPYCDHRARFGSSEVT